MGSVGQVSLEYLLLLACIFSIFAALLPLVVNVFDLCLFGLDVISARDFSSSLEQAVWDVSFQGTGSVFAVSARPVGEWLVRSSGKTLFVEVTGLGHSKVFSVEFPNDVGFFRKSFSSESVFFVSRVSGKVLLEYDDP